MELADNGLIKKCRMELPEETRPARALKEKMKEKNKKSCGKKCKNEARPAKYHNWFTPLSWRIIEQAGQAAGHRMSPTAIVRIAKARNPEIFEGLTRTTVSGWIDRSGNRAKWSEATLRKVETGNAPGHENGGAHGIFVSDGSRTCRSLADIFSRRTTPWLPRRSRNSL
jgi:hypothetical protein